MGSVDLRSGVGPCGVRLVGSELLDRHDPSEPSQRFASTSFGIGSTSTSTSSSTSSNSIGPMVSASLSVRRVRPPRVSPRRQRRLSHPANGQCPVGTGAQLVVFTDTTGVHDACRHREGWTCNGNYGADGSGGLVITPRRQAVPANVDVGWHPASGSPAQAIVGYRDRCQQHAGCGARVCALQRSSCGDPAGPGQTAPASNPHKRGSALPRSTDVAFEDPAGVSGTASHRVVRIPANGVVLYQPKPSESSAYLATCTLPSAQHDLCTAVLNHFVSLYD